MGRWQGRKNIKDNDYGYEYERFFSFFTQDELRNFVKEAGMDIVYEDIISSGKANWIHIIAKKI